MRSLALLILLLVALAVVIPGRIVVHRNDRGVREDISISIPPLPRKPTLKRTKVVPPKPFVQTMTVTGVGTDREHAWQAALRKAAAQIASDYDLRQELSPSEITKDKLVIDSEESTVDLDNSSGEWKQVELTLELSQDYIRGLTQLDRMAVLGKGLALLVAGLFAITGYLRLEEWSKGYFTGLWKVLAALMVMGVGAGVLWLR